MSSIYRQNVAPQGVEPKKQKVFRCRDFTNLIVFVCCFSVAIAFNLGVLVDRSRVPSSGLFLGFFNLVFMLVPTLLLSHSLWHMYFTRLELEEDQLCFKTFKREECIAYKDIDYCARAFRRLRIGLKNKQQIVLPLTIENEQKAIELIRTSVLDYCPEHIDTLTVYLWTPFQWGALSASYDHITANDKQFSKNDLVSIHSDDNSVILEEKQTSRHIRVECETNPMILLRLLKRLGYPVKLQ